MAVFWNVLKFIVVDSVLFFNVSLLIIDTYNKMTECDVETTSTLAIGFGASVVLLIFEKFLGFSKCESNSLLQVFLNVMHHLQTKTGLPANAAENV